MSAKNLYQDYIKNACNSKKYETTQFFKWASD